LNIRPSEEIFRTNTFFLLARVEVIPYEKNKYRSTKPRRYCS